MSDDELTPDQLAWFDQVWAANKHEYEELRRKYREIRAELNDQRVPEPLQIVSLAQALVDNWDVEMLASALTYVIIRDSTHG